MPYKRRYVTGSRQLRSPALLERTMRDRNISPPMIAAYSTARGTKVSRQHISNIRAGKVQSVGKPIADAIEECLQVVPGTLFYPATGPAAAPRTEEVAV